MGEVDKFAFLFLPSHLISYQPRPSESFITHANTTRLSLKYVRELESDRAACAAGSNVDSESDVASMSLVCSAVTHG